MGMASATYPYLRMPGGAARIRLALDDVGGVRAVVQMASHEMGMGTSTVQAQHVAARLGLPFDNVVSSTATRRCRPARWPVARRRRRRLRPRSSPPTTR
jgi:CO/xanthine dehydrogenase Mo-binding subunit